MIDLTTMLYAAFHVNKIIDIAIQLTRPERFQHSNEKMVIARL
jgi:hypothetical protein